MFLFSTRCKIQARKQSRYLSFSRIAAIVVLVAVVYILICHWSKKCSKHIVPFSILHRRVDLSCFIFSSGKVTKTKALDDRSIFLVASACQPLEFRKACAVESAAKYHPDWPVHIILYGRKKVNPNTKTFMSNLKAYRNVFITKIDVPEYFIGTPFEPLLTPESLQEMDFPEYFVSDLVKIATLYNHGGVCLSWNVVVQRSIRTLSNDFFVKEPENKISSAILRLTKSEVGKEMISNIARIIGKNLKFFINKWDLLGNALREICGSTIKNNTCYGIPIYGDEYFPSTYTYGATNASRMSRPYVNLAGLMRRFRSLSQKAQYIESIKKFCPLTIQLAGKLLYFNRPRFYISTNKTSTADDATRNVLVQ